MSEDDDDADDSDHLLNLRAVLRTMPDEEPPERGLAELLAAARARVAIEPAAAMAKPTLLQRIGAWFAGATRRPMVMAMATVMVVAGGALIVHQHGAGDVATPESAQTRAREADVAVAANTASNAMAAPGNASAGSASGSATQTGAPSAPAAEPVAVAMADSSTSAPTLPTTRSAPTSAPTMAPAPTAPAMKPMAPAHIAAPRAPEPIAKLDNESERRGGGFAKAPHEVVASAGEGSVGGGELGDADEGLVAKNNGPRPAPPAPIAASSQGPSPLVSQWLQQCRRAAAVSDCEGVRRLAARIADADPRYYRDHVVKDSSLAHCLTQSTLTE